MIQIQLHSGSFTAGVIVGVIAALAGVAILLPELVVR